MYPSFSNCRVSVLVSFYCTIKYSKINYFVHYSVCQQSGLNSCFWSGPISIHPCSCKVTMQEHGWVERKKLQPHMLSTMAAPMLFQHKLTFSEFNDIHKLGVADPEIHKLGVADLSWAHSLSAVAGRSDGETNKGSPTQSYGFSSRHVWM